MLSAIALIPSAPVLVPELATAAELAALRAAAFAAAAALPDRWIAIGVDAAPVVVDAGAAGTFGGYGAELPVTLSPWAADAPSRLPLCALITGWIRGRVNPTAQAEVRVFGRDLAAADAVAAGRALRDEVAATTEAVGILVVADGAHTLTPSAPGGYDPDSVAVQADLDDALAVGDVAALEARSAGAVGRVAYQVLAGLAGPSATRELYRGAPYGVGYFVGVWTPTGGQERSDRGIGTGGQERSDRGIG